MNPVVARSYAGVYRQRGKLTPEPCVECGEAEVQMHHPDYARPLEVVWLCEPCHARKHGRRPARVPYRDERPCPRCGGHRDKPEQRYCRACHAAYMRQWRAERKT